MKKYPNTAIKLAPTAVCIGLLGVWELGVRFLRMPVWILPPPSQVLVAMCQIPHLLWMHTRATLTEALLGYVLSVTTTLCLALLLYYLQGLYRLLYPVLIISQTIPLIVLAVLLPLWFGWGLLPKVFIVFLVCFFPMLISLVNGLQSVDPDFIDLFRSMGASRLATFFMVVLPNALPVYFAGLRISATYSIMAAVIGEWVGAQKGLGYFMTIQQKSFAIDRVLAAVVIICLLSHLLVKLVDLLEHLMLPWNRLSELTQTNQ